MTQKSSHGEITNEDNAYHFLRIKGTVHFEFIPQGQRVNLTYYVRILKRLREVPHRKWPKIWPNGWILLHDNAPAHKALSVEEFLAQKSITKWDTHPIPLTELRMTFGCFQKQSLP
jgi:hypothetical protein